MTTFAPVLAALSVVPQFARDLDLTLVDGPRSGFVAQMAFNRDGSKLYVARYQTGIFSYDYDPIRGLKNQRFVWSNPAPNPEGGIRGSLGLALHYDNVLGQEVLYFNEGILFTPGHPSSLNHRIQTVRRMTDNDGDGDWGEAGEVNQAILNNVQVTTHHEINNLQVRGNSLFMAIGTQTEPGNNETAYTGSISWIEDLSRLAGDTTTPNIAGFGTPPGNGLGADGYHVDERPFTSTDPSKLRVFSSGLRNPFGLAIQGNNRDGDPWVTMNQTGETSIQGAQPDQLYHSFHYADHGFEKFYQTDGNLQNGLDRSAGIDVGIDPARDNMTNWKQNAAAIAAGFFSTANHQPPIADLGLHTSSNGFDFWYSGANNQNSVAALLNGDAIVTRFVTGDVVAADPVTGQVTQLLSGGGGVLSAVRTPDGAMLIGTSDGIYRLRFPSEQVHPGFPTLFTEDFNGFTANAANFNGGQLDTGLAVAFGGGLTVWQKSGGNAVHVVDHANVFPDIDEARDYAVMVWHNNVITLGFPIIGSNNSGQFYTVDFLASPAVYQHGAQRTTAADGLLIEVLREDGTVLASHVHRPGAWTGDLMLNVNSFQYLGDGSGDVRFRIGPSNPGSGHFGGAIDNFTVTTALVGDFNGDFVVDAADYVIWRKNLGRQGATHAQGDADFDRDVDGGDYLKWRSRFGARIAQAARQSDGGSAAIPEPSTRRFFVVVVSAALLWRPSRVS